MMKKITSLSLLANSISYNVKRTFSALYITGDKASQNFAILNPYIDFEERIVHKNELLQNIKARRISLDIDKIQKKWEFYKLLDDRRKKLLETKTEIGLLITKLIKSSAEHNEEIDKLKLHLKVVKDELKNLKESYYEVEEDTMLKILNLPNKLDNKTPLDQEIICHTYSEKIDNITPSHLAIGQNKNLIEYINHFACFLKSDAALFEQSCLNFARLFLQNLNYIQFSNSNFCRTVIAEGCGDDTYSKLLTLKELDQSESHLNRLHLCGSSSLSSFMAYFARHTVQPTHFPLKYFSVGQNYRNIVDRSYDSLFNLSQEATINIFVATLVDENIFDILISQIKQFYDALGYHYHLTLLPANKLEKAESLRISVQMYSNYLSKYVEVASISSYENFISKRLLFSSSVNKERRFPAVFSGTWLNVPKLVGCVLENNYNNNNSLLSDVLKKHMFQ